MFLQNSIHSSLLSFIFGTKNKPSCSFVILKDFSLNASNNQAIVSRRISSSILEYSEKLSEYSSFKLMKIATELYFSLKETFATKQLVGNCG